jgi:O-antigen/teichoic acid export membrane protein
LGIVHRDGFRLTVVSYAGLILGYINKVLLFPNFLDTDQVGLANIIINIAVIYAQFSALGLHGIVLRFFPFFRDKEKEHHGFLAWSSLIMSVGFILVTLAFILFKPFIVKHYEQDAKLLVDYYYYIIPLAFATVFFQLYDSYLRSLFKTVIPSILNEVVIRLLVTISITMYAVKWIDFQQFVMLYVGVNCSLAVFMIAYTIYIRQFFLRPRLNSRIKRFWGHMIGYGLFSILGSAGNALISNIDVIMIATLVGTQYVNGVKEGSMFFVGIYTTVFFFTTVMLIPYRSILKITSPLVALYWKERNMGEMARLYKRVTSVCMVVGTLVFLGIWSDFEDIFSFMPKQFALGKYVFLYLSLGRLFDMATGLNGVITMTSKKYRYDLIFTICLVIGTIGMNYLFIKVYGMGMNGAALATCITIVVYNVLRLIFVKYFFGIQPFEKSTIWVVLLGVGCFVLNSFLPFIWNVYADLFFRSVLITLLFMGPILIFKIVPDLNVFAIRFLKPLGIRMKFLE